MMILVGIVIVCGLVAAGVIICAIRGGDIERWFDDA